MADPQARIVITAEDRASRAVAALQKNFLGLSGVTTGVGRSVALLGPAFGTFSVAAGSAAAVLRSISGGLESLSDLADATGSSIQNLSGLEGIAGRTGTSLNTVGSAVLKLNKSLSDAKDPTSEAAMSFKALRLNVDELEKLDPSEALLRVATSINGMAEGAGKGRFQLALLGKTTREISPFLKDLADAGKINATVTEEQVAEAEKFNKQLSQLQTDLKDAARSLAGELLPALNDTFEAFRKFGGLKGVGLAIIGQDDLSLTRARADALVSESKRVGDSIDRISVELQRDPGNDFLRGRLDKAREKLAALTRESAKTSEQLKNMAQTLSPYLDPANYGNEGRTRGKPEIDSSGGSDSTKRATADALAASNKISESRLKAIRDGLSAERDLYQFNEQALRVSYADGVISLRAFYDQREALRVQDLAAQRAAVAAEVAELERQRAAAVRSKRPQDVADADTKIQEARARFAAAERESDQARQVAVREQQQDVVQLADRYAELNAQIAALGGNTGPQELLDISRQVNEARSLLTKGGQDNGEADALEAALLRQRRLRQISEQSAGQGRAAANAEARLVIESKRNGAGLLETEQAIRAGREQALAQLDALIVSTKKLAEAGTAGAAQQLDDLQTQRAQLASQVDPTKLRFDAAAEEGAASIADAFREATVEGKNLGDVVSDLDKRLANIVLNEAIFKPLEQGLGNLLKGVTGGGASGGDLFDKAFSFIGSFFHGGGVVGDLGGMQRSVPYGAFSGAPRYHSGGIAGLAADEVPAVLRRGEEVLTQNDPRHRDNASSVGRSVVINAPMNISFNGPADRRSAGQVAAQARLAIEAAGRDL